jgi:ABC-type sugar transport system ATPase subunit
MAYLELHQINKAFGAVKALSNIDLKVEEGTIHALVGENGAGKSTLGKIICGLLQYDSGEMVLKGHYVRYTSPRDAMADGIAGIHQEVTIVPHMTVLENVYLGTEGPTFGFYRDRKLRKDFKELCDRYGFDLAPNSLVVSLSLADKKKVELLRALARNARLIIVDELTASLGADDIKKLIPAIRNLRAIGTTIIYISHFLEEVLALSDVVTVLRNGELIKTSPTSQETPTSLVQAMLGRAIDLGFPPISKPKAGSQDVLTVSGLTRKPAFTDISFNVKEGEIIGFTGLVGSGRTEVARAIIGVDPFDDGEIRLLGQPVKIHSPHEAIHLGITLLPESRKLQGLVMQLPIGQNVTLPHLEAVSTAGFIHTKLENTRARALLEKIDVRPPEPKTPIRSLSGGNQQKVVFAKALFIPPHLLIADEPTSGVDVNARRAIYTIITSLAKEGMAVLLISSEIEEIIGLAHRVYVMSHGRITSVLEGDDINEELIMKAAFNMQENNGQRSSI